MLSFAEFDSLVEPVLMAHNCDSVAGGDCHGGGIQGTFQLSPTGAKNSMYDFNQVKLQVSVTSHANSRILTRPLVVAEGGSIHSGPKPFLTTADPGYQAILEWINDGVTQ